MRFGFILLFCISFHSVAQFTLRVVNVENHEAVVGAKINILYSGKNHYQLADLEGIFHVDDTIPNNTYFVLTATGYDTLKGTLNLVNFHKDQPNELELEPNRLFEEVVVTAQYEPTFVNNTIQKTTLITKEQIEQSGAVNLGDILTYQTGIRLSQDNILGSSMSLGGLSGQNVKILLDGVPIIGRQDGNIDLSQVNLSNIERIEIIEGPLSVNYGTNALAGTINLISKKGQKNGLSFSINPYYESIGNFNLTGTAGYKHKKHEVMIAGGRVFFDGWSENDAFFEFPQARLADTNRFKTWKPKEQYFVDLRYTTRLNSWIFAPYARYFNEVILNRGLPIAPYYQVGIDDYYHTTRKDIGFNLNRNFEKAKFNTIVAFNHFERNKNTYVKDLTTLNNTLSEAIGAQDTSLFTLLNIRSTYVRPLGKKIRIEVGVDVNYETAYGSRIVDLRKNQGDYAAFLSTEWRLFDKLQLKPGLRYGYNTNYDAPLTPSFNAFYKLKNLRFRVAVARGFRAPTLKELYFDFVDINHNIQGNTALKSEHSNNYSGGLTWLKTIKNKHLLQVDYTAFYNDIENLITLGILDDGSYTYINLGEFKSLGNQLKLSVKSNRLTTTVGGSYIGRFNRISSEVSTVNKFAYSPEASVNFSYDLIKDRLKFNSFYKFNGALQTYSIVDDLVEISEQNPYSILDVSFTAKLLNQQLQLTVGAKNLLNVKTVDVVGSTAGGVHSGTGNFNAARGTSVFFSAKYSFNYDFKKK